MSNSYIVPRYLSKGVVLFQPGLHCTEESFADMWDKFRNIIDDEKISLCDTIVTSSNITTITVRNALVKESNKEGISFIRTLFLDGHGHVNDQVEELHTIITLLKGWFGNVPIILVGHSKGGLVNMKYSLKYRGEISKLISIGTPYENETIQQLHAIIRSWKPILKTTLNSRFSQADIQDFENLLHEVYDDEDLGNTSFFNQLKNDWNSLSASEKPEIVCIACSQVGFSSNPELGSDLVVSVPTQKALNYNDITKRIQVTKNYEYFRQEWYDSIYQSTLPGKIESLVDISNAIISASKTHDLLYLLLGFFLTMVPYTWDNKDYDLIHTQELRNPTVCNHVIEEIVLTMFPINNYS